MAGLAAALRCSAALMTHVAVCAALCCAGWATVALVLARVSCSGLLYDCAAGPAVTYDKCGSHHLVGLPVCTAFSSVAAKHMCCMLLLHDAAAARVLARVMRERARLDLQHPYSCAVLHASAVVP
jgi:hypothetical protein